MIVEPDFLDHWKTQLLRDKLGGDAAVIVLLRLWGHCQQRKAWVFQFTADKLKAICRWTGDAAVLLSSLVDSGWLEAQDGGNYAVHQWEIVNASLVSAWENGSKGGRPNGKTHRKPVGYPPVIPQDTGRPPDRGDREDRRDRVDGDRAPAHDFFPPEGFPFRFSARLQAKSHLLGDFTPGALTASVLGVTAYQTMPEDEWFRAADEFASLVNSGGEEPRIPRLQAFIRSRFDQWTRSSRGPSTPFPKNNGAAGIPPNHGWDGLDPLANAPVGT